MLVFTEVVFDQVVHGGPAYSEEWTWSLLARAERFAVHARTSQAGGSSPTITLKLERSDDGTSWGAKSTMLSAANLTANLVQQHYGWDVGTTPAGRYVRLAVELGGGSPSVRVRVMVAGRAREAPE